MAPSTGEVQVWPISVQGGAETITGAGVGVAVTWAGVAWTAGVTRGVMETRVAGGAVTVVLDAVGSAVAGGRVFPLHAARKTVASMVIVLRVE